MREEVLKILLTITPSEAAMDDVMDGEEYESELTKMAEGQVSRGVNEVSAGEKNLDAEFKKKTPGAGVKKANKPTAKKSTKRKKKSKKKRK